MRRGAGRYHTTDAATAATRRTQTRARAAADRRSMIHGSWIVNRRFGPNLARVTYSSSISVSFAAGSLIGVPRFEPGTPAGEQQRTDAHAARRTRTAAGIRPRTQAHAARSARTLLRRETGAKLAQNWPITSAAPWATCCNGLCAFHEACQGMFRVIPCGAAGARPW